MEFFKPKVLLVTSEFWATLAFRQHQLKTLPLEPLVIWDWGLFTPYGKWSMYIFYLEIHSPPSIWRLKSIFWPNSLAHLSHLNSFIPWWTTLWCFMSFCLSVNFNPQSEHMWFLTPSWTNAICLLRIIFSEKSFPHRLQWKSFFPWRLWYLKWRFRLLSNVNDFPHRWQISKR